MPDYTIAIIGLGMGYRHLRAVEQHPQTTVAAVCDIDIEKARAIAQQHGVPTAVSDYRALLDLPDIDIVIVASPDHLHCEQTVTMLEAGKHVLCEKPMAPTLAACQRMVEAQVRSQRTLMIGHIVRFTPIFRTIKQLVDDGELGELFYVGTDYQHNDLTKIGGWRFDPQRARHVFMGDGCHAVDLMRWFLSELSDVTAVANRKALLQSSTDDCIVACYTTTTNQLGRVFVSNGCQRPYAIGLEVYGTPRLKPSGRYLSMEKIPLSISRQTSQTALSTIKRSFSAIPGGSALVSNTGSHRDSHSGSRTGSHRKSEEETAVCVLTEPTTTPPHVEAFVISLVISLIRNIPHLVL